MLRFEKFGIIDGVSDFSQGYTAFVDVDTDKPTTFPEIVKLLRLCDVSGSNVCYHRTRRGWHIILCLEQRLKPVELVALQSILGDDPYRAALNFQRARNIEKIKGFWTKRWNILYSKKVAE